MFAFNFDPYLCKQQGPKSETKDLVLKIKVLTKKLVIKHPIYTLPAPLLCFGYACRNSIYPKGYQEKKCWKTNEKGNKLMIKRLLR